MTQAIIRAEFESRLAAWAATKGFPVAWENRTFSPPTGTYLRSNLLPASNTTLDLATRDRQYEGVYQVGLVMAGGSGPGAADALAAELDAVFPTGGQMVRSGVRIWITRPMSPSPGLNEPEGRWFVPVSCRYVGYTP